ncbi:hypothetical protein VWM68_10375, partial [Campylobacter coli]
FALQYLAQFPDSKEASAIIWYNEAKHWFGFVSSVFVAFIKMLQERKIDFDDIPEDAEFLGQRKEEDEAVEDFLPVVEDQENLNE